MYGEENADTAHSYVYVGHSYVQLGKHKKSLEYFDKSLQIRLKLYGEVNADTA